MLSVSLSRVVQLVALLGGAAVAMFVIALSPWVEGLEARLSLLGLAAFTALQMARYSTIRLRLHGDGFQVHRLLGEVTGSAEDFIGWRHGLSGTAQLLLRDGLRWIELPAFTGGDTLDEDIERWVRTFLPVVDATALAAVRRGAELSRAHARSLLDRSLSDASSEGFYGGTADLALARAARAVAVHRDFEARSSLEALLPRLPLPSVAAAYVFDALRQLGNASTAAALERVLARYKPEKQHLARAFCAVAATAQRPTLQTLLSDEDRFVQRQAEQAIRRLQSGSA